jgi:hypothetical protein
MTRRVVVVVQAVSGVVLLERVAVGGVAVIAAVVVAIVVDHGHELE